MPTKRQLPSLSLSCLSLSARKLRFGECFMTKRQVIKISEQTWQKAEKDGNIQVSISDRQHIIMLLEKCVSWIPALKFADIKHPIAKLEAIAEDFSDVLRAFRVSSLSDAPLHRRHLNTLRKSHRNEKDCEIAELHKRAIENARAALWGAHEQELARMHHLREASDLYLWLSRLEGESRALQKIAQRAQQELKAYYPAGKRPPDNALHWCISNLARVYQKAGGTIAGNRDKSTNRWSPFVRWLHCLMRCLPPGRRPKLDALGHTVQRLRPPPSKLVQKNARFARWNFAVFSCS